MDEEATDIFWGYLKYYYDDTSYNLEGMIGNTFAKTAEVIMGHPDSSHGSMITLKNCGSLLLIVLFVVVAVLFLLILLAFAIGKREKRALPEDVSAAETGKTIATAEENGLDGIAEPSQELINTNENDENDENSENSENDEV